jgi:hypothetical protein
MRQLPSKSSRKPSQTRKNRVPPSTVKVLIPEVESDKAVTSRTLAGKQIDRSDEQFPKTLSPMVEI